MLYGVSYGTLVATIAASRNGAKPTNIILEGVVGRSLSQRDYAMAFIKQWESYEKTVDPALLKQFKEVVRGFIQRKEFTADDFGDLIQALLLVRHLPNAPNVLDYYLQHIANEPIDTVRERLTSVITEMHQNMYSNESMKLFHAVIDCREMFADGHPDSADLSFDGIELKESAPGNCPTYVSPGQENYYDSAKYQLSSPTTYIVGADDPATPVWQARYHFDHQYNAKKYWISVPDGGHAPLDKELSNCSTNFWVALAKEPQSAIAQLTPCLKVGTSNKVTSPTNSSP